MQWIRFPDERFQVNGLAWFEEQKPSLSRLPRRLKRAFRPGVWGLAQCPAGGRIRFRTNSSQIGIRAKCADNRVMDHITRIGQSGFDLYLDRLYMASVAPNEFGKIQAEWPIGSTRQLREITIHMPLYKPVKINSIGLDAGSAIDKPRPFALPKPMVFYGTSITQGGCASNPGMSYQAVASRLLNVDFINLGFSGNGLGDPELARAICEIPSACIVLDHWANIGLGLEENLPIFVDLLREKQPRVPIVVMGAFFCSRELAGDTVNSLLRKVARKFVRQRNRAGDHQIFYLDGLKMISRQQTFGLVDGCHCNSVGFYFIGRSLAASLKRIL